MLYQHHAAVFIEDGPLQQVCCKHRNALTCVPWGKKKKTLISWNVGVSDYAS